MDIRTVYGRACLNLWSEEIHYWPRFPTASTSQATASSMSCYKGIGGAWWMSNTCATTA